MGLGDVKSVYHLTWLLLLSGKRNFADVTEDLETGKLRYLDRGSGPLISESLNQVIREGRSEAPTLNPPTNYKDAELSTASKRMETLTRQSQDQIGRQLEMNKQETDPPLEPQEALLALGFQVEAGA